MKNNPLRMIECARCGIEVPQGQCIKWKHYYCPDCIKRILPFFDIHQNIDETTADYLEMKKRYIGRKVKEVREEIKRIDIDIYARDFVHYYMDITVDQEGYIVDVSRLNAIILPTPHSPYEEGRPYPIKPEDYFSTVDVIFQDDIRFDD